jgi:glycosyltransferase involved in cell wall biosynthesis
MEMRTQDSHITKVLYCILDNRPGGPHRRSHAISRWLREHGVETLFLLGYKAGETWHPDGFPSFLCRNIQCFRRRSPILNLIRFAAWLPYNLLRIARIIRSNEIDLVHVDGVSNIVPALAARLTGRPVVWLYNDYLPPTLQRILLPLVTALANLMLVQGEILRQSLTVGRPALRDKTVVLNSAVDTRRFTVKEGTPALRRTVRQELGIPDHCPVVGTVRNVNPLKGFTYFLEAAGRIKKKTESVKFLIVGRKLDTDGGYWDQLQRLTARLGLEGDVIYTGFRDDIPVVLSALDVFVLASLQESCPVALLEAMAMKTPVVATDVGAVREMVEHGRTGFVVPPANAEALAEAVLTLLALPPEQARTMVQEARKTVEQRFAIDTIARQQLQVYESL